MGSLINKRSAQGRTDGVAVPAGYVGERKEATLSTGATLTSGVATDSWVPNNVTLNRNGLNIEGVAANFVLDVDGGSARLKYFNAAQGWRIY